MAADMSIPDSRFRITWAMEGKIREPPEPPRTAYSDESELRMIEAAVEDKGLSEGQK
jgi:hypothetical protein